MSLTSSLFFSLMNNLQLLQQRLQCLRIVCCMKNGQIPFPLFLRARKMVDEQHFIFGATGSIRNRPLCVQSYKNICLKYFYENDNDEDVQKFNLFMECITNYNPQFLHSQMISSNWFDIKLIKSKFTLENQIYVNA